MSAFGAGPDCTPEELLALPDGDHFELVGGRLVERHSGQLSSWIGGRIACLIGNFGEDRGLGWILGADCGYQCFPDDPLKVRRPDVSFVTTARLPGGQLAKGHVPYAPDLAVEVVSPNDLAYEIAVKVEEYLDAGVRLVWVVNPATRTVLIYRADRSVTQLYEADELSGEDVLPGFTCPVATLFPPS